MSSELAADVTAILDGIQQLVYNGRLSSQDNKPIPMRATAAAGAASPALVWVGGSGAGYVGKFGWNTK